MHAAMYALAIAASTSGVIALFAIANSPAGYVHAATTSALLIGLNVALMRHSFAR
jgi:hypothetical protein